jgi:hypothetical protein
VEHQVIPPLVARILLGLLLAGVVGAFAWRHCVSLWRYWSAPLRNDHHRFLSLTRIVFAVLILVGQIPVMTKEFFWKYGGAGVVIVEVIAMLGDIVVSKGGLAVLMALAGNKASALPNLAVSVPGMTAGAAPLPAAGPAPEISPPPAPEKPDLAEQAG